MIFVAGSANLDFVVRAAHIPAPGETVLGRDFQTFAGGKGANQAVASARAGAMTTHMLLALGNDAHAAPLEQSLSAAGVCCHIVRDSVQATGTAFICVADDADNAITVAPGANQSLRDSDLPPPSGFSHLLLQLETPLPTVTAYARAAREQGVSVVLNAAPAQVLSPDVLALIDVLIVNKGELAVLAQHPGSIAECLARIDVPCVVVTLGDRGCCARSGTSLWTEPAFAVTSVDSTGAGDTFCGVLVAALSLGNSLVQALRQASAAAALACTRAGAQASIPTHGELTHFLAAQPVATLAQITALNRYCGFDS